MSVLKHFLKLIFSIAVLIFHFGYVQPVQKLYGQSWLILFIIIKKKQYGIDIHTTTQIGYGLFIGHGGPLVVNPTTVIGNNVNLSQFTTIGANGGRQAAEIGDNVYIGPNVCIIEHVKIGNNATIGAGSVVTKDIPENATAVGNYAKVISMNNPGHAVNRRWTDF